MEGSKIKNIIIVILLLLNGFLLYLVGGRWLEDSHSHEAARNSAIQVIRAGGVELEDATVPREITLSAMQAVRDLDTEQRLAQTLLGDEVRVEARGGEVYRYRSANGWIQFHSTGEFMAEFEPGVFPLGGQQAARQGAELLRQLDFEGQVLEDTVTDGQGSITYLQTLAETLLLGCQATVNYREGSLVSITDGRRLPGQPQQSAGEGAMSVATALMRCYNGLKELGDLYTCIESITPAYTLSINLSGPAQLTPVWYVRTDTGAYQLDTLTGQISRVSGVGTAEALADATVQEEF